MLKRILTCSVALAFAGPAIADQQITVDCSTGSIGQVLGNKGDKSKPLLLRVRGNCAEHVIIERDDVTVVGDGAGRCRPSASRESSRPRHRRAA